ncbi:glycerophosphodiester phosphodiesterase family protein [Spirosoma knui]
MKQTLSTLLLFIGFSTLYAQSGKPYITELALEKALAYRTNRVKPLILAHRGGPQLSETENSLETFQRMYQQVPEAILEMDVRMTADSVLALLHDDDIKRTTTGTGSFQAMNWEVLRQVYLRDLQGNPTRQRIPRFADVVRWGAGKVIMAIDAKPGVNLRNVMKEIVDAGALHSVFIICYSVDDAIRLRTQYPALWIALGVNEPKQLDTFRKSGLALRHLIALASPQEKEFYQQLHQAGIPCTAGTYGAANLDEKPIQETADAYRNLVRKGVDILTTDRPVEVSRLFN